MTDQRFRPERWEQNPEEKFRAWIAANPVERAYPSRLARWRANAEFLIALALIFGVGVAFVLCRR